jgi:hypothetical protein
MTALGSGSSSEGKEGKKQAVLKSALAEKQQFFEISQLFWRQLRHSCQSTASIGI